MSNFCNRYVLLFVFITIVRATTQGDGAPGGLSFHCFVCSFSFFVCLGDSASVRDFAVVYRGKEERGLYFVFPFIVFRGRCGVRASNGTPKQIYGLMLPCCSFMFVGACVCRLVYRRSMGAILEASPMLCFRLRSFTFLSSGHLIAMQPVMSAVDLLVVLRRWLTRARLARATPVSPVGSRLASASSAAEQRRCLHDRRLSAVCATLA